MFGGIADSGVCEALAATTCDVAIIGLGAVGAAAAVALTRRGAKVIGFDRFSPPHTSGSSHGGTRVTRLAIGEGDHLTPLAIRSHELWRQIEEETGGSLLEQTGALIISSEVNAAVTHVEGFFARTIAAAETFGIAHEVLDAGDIRARWPQFKVHNNEMGYFEPSAGFVRPEECVRAQLKLAQRHGADIHVNEEVLGFDLSSSCVTVKTSEGCYSAHKLVLSAGAWLPDLLGARYGSLFKVYRQAQFWFEVDDLDALSATRFPVFIWELQNSKQGLYGFPMVDGGTAVKVASERFEVTTTPAVVNRKVSAEEIHAMAKLIAPHLCGISARCVEATACLYTVTPDFGFVIDKHPISERVIIASTCSGHGFKHSPAIGEALADLALDRQGRFDLAPFRMTRFQ